MRTYTVKEAAVLLGMTKTGVSYHLRRMNKPLAKDGEGRITIDEETFQQLLASVKPQSRPQSEEELSAKFAQSEGELGTNLAQSGGEVSAKSQSKPQSEDSDLRFALEFLREQLSVKDAQIAKKDAQIAKKDEQIAELNKQISDLNENLRREQELHARQQTLLHDATVSRMLQEAVPPEPTEDPTPEPEPVTVTEEVKEEVEDTDPPPNGRRILARLSSAWHSFWHSSEP